MSKRGRPKKTGYSENGYMNINIPKEGELIRERKVSPISKFDNDKQLYQYLIHYLDISELSPLGIIIFNSDKSNLDNIQYHIYRTKNLEKAASLVTAELVQIRNHYNTINSGFIKTIAYNAHINLDMRKYKNLSVIYHIIYELQQKLFSNQYTIWKLQAPIYNQSPFYVLKLLVSNPTISGKGYLSYMFSGDGFTHMNGVAYGTINGTRAICSDKENKINLKPVYFLEKDYRIDMKKPDGMKYIDWYKMNYGEDIINPTPNRLINTKSYTYSREEK